ncbi:MAG TPA: MFS transporter [Phycisphaerae bacterium]|nr:MFS transporter [Phycisphaerae bacterium]
MPWRRKTYDELPALSVRRHELRRSLRLTTVAWMLGVVWMACVMGSQVNLYARMLGFSDFEFGVLGALPFVGTLGQLVAAVLIERTGLKKYQFLFCGTIHRLMWLAIAAVPLVLPIPSKLAVWTMLMMFVMSSFMAHLASTAWLTWMGDLIPRQVRGRYFANRMLFTRPILIAVAIAVGLVLDWASVPGAPVTGAAQPKLLWVLCGIFAVAALFGVGDILVFHKVREVLPSLDEDRLLSAGIDGLRSAVRQLVVEPLKNRVFVHYVCYGATITFALTCSAQFIWRNALEYLEFSKLTTQILLLVVSPIMGVVGVKTWGALVDRWGRRPVMILSTFLAVLSISPWLFAKPHMPAPAFVSDSINAVLQAVGSVFGRSDWARVSADMGLGTILIVLPAPLIGGIAGTGIGLAQMSVILGFADGHGRSKYMAAAAVMIGVGGMLGGLAGGVVAQVLRHLQQTPIELGPLAWTNWHIVFLVSIVFRIASLLWLVNMPDPGSRPVRHLARVMGGHISNAVVNRLFFPLRVFGWGRGGNRRQRRRTKE